ncbi:hypothetical protein U1769_09830 [Sphingomonas sp. ZT3P38]|uniref:hypothetical protein n=1 Tax=Parasphingomonas zepuensis TaxID=3096161 RepID=UPI002FC64AE9
MDAQPGKRGPNIGRLVVPDRDADRDRRPGGHEDPFDPIIISDGALKERPLDPCAGLLQALGNGSGEIAVIAPPCGDGRFGHIEDIGDLFERQPMTAELAGLRREGRCIAIGRCGGGRTGNNSLFRRDNRENHLFFRWSGSFF